MENDRICSVIAFCCDNSAYRAADSCGYQRMELPEELEIVRVPCLGSVDSIDILREFENGARGVMLMGCHEDSCRHITGNSRMRERLVYLKSVLAECGIDDKEVAIFHISPFDVKKFADQVRDFCNKIKNM